MLNRRDRIEIVAVSLFIALAGLLLASSFFARPADRVSAQTSVTGAQTMLLTAANNVTQAVTTQPFLVQGYGVADCYAKATTVGGEQIVTFTLQHGPNTGDFVNLLTFPALDESSASGVEFTTTLLYGNYLKAATVLNNNTISVTYYVQCIVKNR